MFGECLDSVRRDRPCVLCITNYVTANDVANTLLACSARPVMSDDVSDAAEIATKCDALYLNIGTLNEMSVKSMLAAGKTASEKGIPIVLDPVGAGASEIRTDTALSLIEQLRITAVRGNMSEIKALLFGSSMTRGVDVAITDAVNEENLPKCMEIVKDFASKINCLVAATGPIDIVSDTSSCCIVRNGRPEMELVTGTGCQLSGLAAAFLASNRNNSFSALSASVCVMGLAGETAWKAQSETDGNSTYRNRITDSIFCMDGRRLEEGARYEIF